MSTRTAIVRPRIMCHRPCDCARDLGNARLLRHHGDNRGLATPRHVDVRDRRRHDKSGSRRRNPRVQTGFVPWLEGRRPIDGPGCTDAAGVILGCVRHHSMVYVARGSCAGPGRVPLERAEHEVHTVRVPGGGPLERQRPPRRLRGPPRPDGGAELRIPQARIAKQSPEQQNASYGLDSSDRGLETASPGRDGPVEVAMHSRGLVQSMDFAGELVSLGILEALHSRQPMPTIESTP